MEIKNRKSVFDNLNKYCYLSKEHDCIEVTEWTNGEGYDISISSDIVTKQISLTCGELEAINYLAKTLDYQKN